MLQLLIINITIKSLAESTNENYEIIGVDSVPKIYLRRSSQ